MEMEEEGRWLLLLLLLVQKEEQIGHEEQRYGGLGTSLLVLWLQKAPAERRRKEGRKEGRNGVLLILVRAKEGQSRKERGNPKKRNCVGIKGMNE